PSRSATNDEAAANRDRDHMHSPSRCMRRRRLTQRRALRKAAYLHVRITDSELLRQGMQLHHVRTDHVDRLRPMGAGRSLDRGNSEHPMRPEDSLGKTIRVYYNGFGRDDDLAVEGMLIAVVPTPVIVVDDAQGERHYLSSTLRREVQHVEWLPA